MFSCAREHSTVQDTKMALWYASLWSQHDLKIYTNLLLFVLSLYFTHVSTSCPSVCSCDKVLIDCAGKNLDKLPAITGISSTVVVNMSSNSLVHLEIGKNTLPSHSILDLSYNQISRVDSTFFSAEPFSRLMTLNISSNKLTVFDFVLPASVQILRLSQNSIDRFSVNTLKHLSQLKILYIDFNKLVTVAAEREKGERQTTLTEQCPFTPLEHIQEISFQGNKLTSIDMSVFKCFHNVQYLSLADNKLRSIPVKIFSTFRHLQFLDLSRNHLVSVPPGVFSRLSGLKFLSLSGNHLEAVPAGLPMMEWLDLSYNAVTMVTEQQKSDLYPQEVFLLGGNPLHCVCELLWLKELFDTREYLLKYISVDRSKFVPVCASPNHIRGDTWDVLGDESFGCKGADSKQSKVPDENESSVVRLDDLSVKVQEVGPNFVTLEWDSLNLLTSTSNPADIVERNKVFISFHPFGKKGEKISVSVHLTTGSYKLKALRPNTAYVICLSLTDPLSKTPHAKVKRDDCVEIVTKDEDAVGKFLADHYIQVTLVLLIFILLLIKCCCQSSRPVELKEKKS